MNIPVPPISADLIAITGLSGHAFGSWRSRVGTAGRPLDRPMWLRDFLPERFPQTRIMTYGYDSSLSRPTGYNLFDYARELEQCITNARRDCPHRPIVFIAHSLGGLLVNQLLLKWAQQPESDSPLHCVRGILFFGTPHNGLRTKELSEMVNKGISNEKTQTLLAQLAEGSEFLESQKDNLCRMWNRYRGKLFTFYETEKTNVVKEAAPGVWDRSGGLFQMVQRSSAQLFLPNELRFPVQSNHTDMVKFNSPDDKAFQDVVTCIKSCEALYNRMPVIKSLVQAALALSDTLLYVGETLDYNRGDQPDDSEDTYAADFLFLLYNLDYQNWISKTAQVQTLVYTSFHCVPYYIPRLIQILRNTEQNCLLLFFTHSRGQKINHMGGLVSAMVGPFFRQLMETFPREQGRSLLEMFLHILLTSLLDDLLVHVQRRAPETYLDTIISYSKPDILWAALEEVLAKGADLYTCSEKPSKPDLRIMLDLSSAKSNRELEVRAVIKGLRLVTQRLRRSFSTVKLLINDPPEIASLHLLQPSEVLVTHDQERQECLDTLYFKNLRYDKISVHHSHTLAWLWKSPEYKSWISLKHPYSGLLFIEGKPGSGKSTLARYFADNFTPPSKAIVLKFFYNKRNGEPERDHRNMLRTLLYQILKADESFFIHFQSIYRRGGGRGIEWCSEDMRNILRACKTHPRPHTIYLIIDAMDESACTDRAETVQFLHELSTPASSNGGCTGMINVFLASRPINELQPTDHPGRQKIRLQEVNRGDIERYTHNILQNEDFASVNSEVKEEIEKYILTFSDGVFIWVCLVLKELAEEAMNGSRRSTLISFLKALPKTLERLYECMVQRLASNKGQAKMDGKRILQFCLFSERAMALVDLEHALAIPGLAEAGEPDPKSWTSEIPLDIYKMLNHCVGGFVDVKANYKTFPAVQVMHQTVREFFLRPGDLVRRSHLNVIEKDALHMIELTCVRFLEIVREEGARLALHRRPGVDSVVNLCRHLKYLEERPLIKYSLEYLGANPKAWVPTIADRVSILLDRVESSPPSLMMVIFSKLLSITTDRSFGVDTQFYFDRLMLDAARKGYSTAIRNLLVVAPSETVDVKNERNETPLHLAAGGGHYPATMFLLDSGAHTGAKDVNGRTALHHAVLNGHKAIVQLLLTNNEELGNCLDGFGQSALHLAALSGSEALVEVLLADGSGAADLIDRNGQSALRLATINGHTSVVQLLLDTNADLLAQDMSGQNALHHAAINGHEAIAQLLLNNNAHLEAIDTFGRTALHLAALNGHGSICQLLLDTNADLLAQDMSGQNALHHAAINGHEAIAQLLLNNNADLEAIDTFGRTALHLAAHKGHGSMCQLLLDTNADLLAQDMSGRNALHHAAMNGHAAITQLLLTKGVSPNPHDFIHQTPLHHAAMNGHEAIVQLLLNNNADLEAIGAFGRTALHLAAHKGHGSICQLLVDTNADLLAQDMSGQNALHHAAMNGHAAIAQLLLTKGVSPNPHDFIHQTPLHHAAMNGHEAIVQLLLNSNADLEAMDAPGRRTALHFAAKNGHGSICQLLLANNADLQAQDVYGQTAADHAARNGHHAIAQTHLNNHADVRP